MKLAAWQAFADLYRLRHKEKVSSFRLLLYVLFGYLVSGQPPNLPLYSVNLAMVVSGLLAASLLNDTYDYRLLGEQNAVGSQLQDGTLTPRRLTALIALPAAAMAGLLVWQLALHASRLASLLWLLSFILGCAYSLPPFRLKERRPVALLVSPFCIYLLFLQGLLLAGWPTAWGWAVAAFVWLFSWYAEFLHAVDDSLQPHEVKKLPTAQGMKWLKRISFTGVFVGLLYALNQWCFLISAAAWGLRLFAIRKVQPAQLPDARRSLRHPVWRIEEFVAYALLSLAGVFR